MKKEDDEGHPTVFDLLNQRMEETNGKIRESITELQSVVDAHEKQIQVNELNVDRLSEKFSVATIRMDALKTSVEMTS